MESGDGLTELVEAHRDRIFSYSCYYLGRADEAEDVTQEVLVRLWRYRHTVRNGSIGSWLTSVTRNACIDMLRKRKSYRAVVSEGDYSETIERMADDTGRDPGETSELHDLRAQIRSAITRLDDPYRSLLILRELQGMSYAELVEALEMPLNTVKCYLHRARKMLRDELKEGVAHGDL